MVASKPVPGYRPLDGGLYLGKVYALRRWVAPLPKNDLDMALYSPHAVEPYEPGKPASCKFSDHEAPQADCTCGYYASDIGRPFGGLTGNRNYSTVVELTGDIVVSELGVRSRAMKVVAIAPLAGASTKTLKALGEMYGVPVYKSQRLMLEAHPLTPLDRGKIIDAQSALEFNSAMSPARYIQEQSRSSALSWLLILYTLAILLFAFGDMAWDVDAPAGIWSYIWAITPALMAVLALTRPRLLGFLPLSLIPIIAPDPVGALPIIIRGLALIAWTICVPIAGLWWFLVPATSWGQAVISLFSPALTRRQALADKLAPIGSQMEKIEKDS